MYNLRLGALFPPLGSGNHEPQGAQVQPAWTPALSVVEGVSSRTAGVTDISLRRCAIEAVREAGFTIPYSLFPASQFHCFTISLFYFQNLAVNYVVNIEINSTE
jgi:hypothetical protein